MSLKRVLRGRFNVVVGNVPNRDISIWGSFNIFLFLLNTVSIRDLIVASLRWVSL